MHPSILLGWSSECAIRTGWNTQLLGRSVNQANCMSKYTEMTWRWLAMFVGFPSITPRPMIGWVCRKSDPPDGIWDGDDTELELRQAGHDLDIDHISEEYVEKSLVACNSGSGEARWCRECWRIEVPAIREDFQVHRLFHARNDQQHVRNSNGCQMQILMLGNRRCKGSTTVAPSEKSRISWLYAICTHPPAPAHHPHAH